MSFSTPDSPAPVRAITLIRNVVRAREIFGVVGRNGFLEFLEQVNAPSMWIARILPIRPQNLTLWQRIRVICEELGPTFVKLAQIASTREDLLPEGLAAELRQLRDAVGAMPWEKMEAVLNAELRGGIAEHFSEFNREPIACGSIGQVYRARLKKDGREVAVKIQRPGIRRAMRADFEIIAWLAQRTHERFPDLRPLALPTIIAEAGTGVLQELDFTIEARNATYFNTLNTHPEVFAPAVIQPLCTPRILVSEWVEGHPPGDAAIPPELGVKLAVAGANSVFRQIFLNGFFHADPHTGNLLVTQDGRLCMLDWGLAGSLTRRMRHMLADLFGAMTARDPEKVLHALLAGGLRKLRLDRARLETDIGQVLRRHADLAERPGGFGHAMTDLLRVFARHGISMARDYTLLAKAVLAIEDAGRKLDPHFELPHHARSFLRKLTSERHNPLTLAKLSWRELLVDYAQLREMPGTVSRILQKLEDGEINLSVEHNGMDEFRGTLEVSVNRLVFAIIVAALLIGSSMLARGEANLWSFPPSLGMTGYLLAVCFTLYLILDILRHGRHKR